MKRAKRALAALICMVVCMIATVSQAEQAIVPNGKTSNNEESFAWDVNNGFLRINGSGATPSYDSISDLPWFEELDRIERVFIDGDFTSIGTNMLSGLDDETRIDFRMQKMPTMDTKAVTGVCRYYSTDESWANAPDSWIYLPVYSPDRETINHIVFEKDTGWCTISSLATNFTSYPLDARQALELTYTGRNISLDAIPEGENLKVITDHWDTTWMIAFGRECSGTFNLEIPSMEYCIATFDVDAPELTLNIDASRIDEIRRLLVGAGAVTFKGNLDNLYLRHASAEISTPSLIVDGDVKSLDFYDKTSNAAYTGSVTVTGTIQEGTQYGSMVIAVPHISDKVTFPDMVKAGFENVQQGAPVITDGELTVAGAESIDGLTYEDFDLRYHLMPDGWRLDLRPKPDSEFGSYGASIDDVEAYNPDFTTSDILWGENTEVYVWDVRDLGTLRFNGGENGEGLGTLTLSCCIAEVNCPVQELYIRQSYSDTAATTVTINSAVKTLTMEMRKTGNTVTLGEGGSVSDGSWNRYLGEYRYFGPLTVAGNLYSDDQLKVLSWKWGQEIKAKLPSNDAVTEAVGQAAMADVDQSDVTELNTQEKQALDTFLAEQGEGVVVAEVFDATVKPYTVNAQGDLIPGDPITTRLNQPISITVSNNTGEASYIVRLHDDNGTVTADQLTEATTGATIPFESDLFSKYIIVKTETVTPAMGTPTFVTPTALETIEAEAFAGMAAKVIRITGKVTAIGEKAFADSDAEQAIIENPDTVISDTAFEGCDELIIFGVAGGKVQQWAEAHAYAFYPIQE